MHNLSRRLHDKTEDGKQSSSYSRETIHTSQLNSASRTSSSWSRSRLLPFIRLIRIISSSIIRLAVSSKVVKVLWRIILLLILLQSSGAGGGAGSGLGSNGRGRGYVDAGWVGGTAWVELAAFGLADVVSLVATADADLG